MNINPPHVPAGFDTRGKPHICRASGQWWMIWPQGKQGPSIDEAAAFGPFLRKINGVIEPRPTSLLYHAWPALQ